MATGEAEEVPREVIMVEEEVIGVVGGEVVDEGGVEEGGAPEINGSQGWWDTRRIWIGVHSDAVKASRTVYTELILGFVESGSCLLVADGDSRAKICGSCT